VEQQLENMTPVAIDPGPPAVVRSSIEVSCRADEVVRDVSVVVDLEHDWIGDVVVSLLSPRGRRVVLMRRRGGRPEHLRATEFAMRASLGVGDATLPFTGALRPAGDLHELRGSPAAGPWTLEVADQAFQNGGTLHGWNLALETAPAQTAPFAIDVRFRGGLTEAQQDAFAAAAERWSQIIVGDVPDVTVGGETIDDVVIEAEGVPIDGPGKVLGQAGPTTLRPGSLLPAQGVMSFDTADLAQMEADGSLVRVIMHEMAHVLGFGTIWDQLGLLQGAGSANPTFTGAAAIREFAALRGEGAAPMAVPVANVGGAGTRDSHWREAVFANELMTGFLDTGVNPISRMTVGSLEDLGYEVDYGAADPYVLPTPQQSAILGVGAESADHGGHGIILRPPQTVLPLEALRD
jgi:subtilisin-like proprotein convertase family protein